MTEHRSTRFFFLLVVAALFALHFQLMPRVAHAADHQSASATAVVHLHNGDCNGGCCRGAACCIQTALFAEAVLSSPRSPRFGFPSQAAFPLWVVKPLYPPPKTPAA